MAYPTGADSGFDRRVIGASTGLRYRAIYLHPFLRETLYDAYSGDISLLSRQCGRSR